MGAPTHAVHVNGLCASRMLGKARAFAAAADAVAARPDAVVSVVRYADVANAYAFETVAVVSRADAPMPADAPTPADADADADADAYAAWCAADLALADVVRWRDVRGAVTDASDADAEATYAMVRDAVADARAGYEPDADAVVVVPAERVDAFGLLQRAGVSVVRRGTPADAGAAWLASHNGAPAVGAAHVADAVAYACGDRRPTPRRAVNARGRLSGDA